MNKKDVGSGQLESMVSHFYGENYMIKKDDVIEVAIHNPILYQCMTMVNLKICTWEEAMMTAVVSLAEQNAQLTKSLVTATMKLPPPSIVINKNKG